MTKMILKFVVALCILLTPAAYAADLMPKFDALSTSFKAGITGVHFHGKQVKGYRWEASVDYKINDYISAVTGLGQTRSEVQEHGNVNKLVSSNIPVAVQVNMPLEIGSLYVRAGANRYQNTYGNQTNTGWGKVGAVGLNLASSFNIDGAIELSYVDSGAISSKTLMIGANITF